MNLNELKKKLSSCEEIQDSEFLNQKLLWNKYAGNYNPVINDWIVENFNLRNSNVYIPFCGLTHGSRYACFKLNYVCSSLIAHDLEETDYCDNVNSIKKSPKKKADFVVFHPPYYGSAIFTESVDALELDDSFESYISKLKECVSNFEKEDQTVCVVARSYEHHGNNYDLDYELTKIFIDKGYNVFKVAKTKEDNVIILRK